MTGMREPDELIKHRKEQMQRVRDTRTMLEKRSPNSSHKNSSNDRKKKLSLGKRNAAKKRMQRIVSVSKLKSMHTLRT